jgi:hypothetical protein
LKKLSITVGLSSALSILGLALQTAAEATIVRINQSAFTPAAGLITFSEKPLGTQNPVYLPAEYGGAFGAPIVSFGGTFAGQTVGIPPIPPGALPSGVVNGAPNNPLSLVNSPATFITSDGANPTSPVLSGTPTFNGPVSILFSVDVAGVGLDGGFFNAIGGTAISAFDRNGNLLGQVLNEALGIEFLGLVTQDGQSKIAGLQFSLVGAEPAGFAIDNLRFGTTGQVVPPEPIPTPALLPGLIGMGVAALRKRKSEAADAADNAEA